jgi:ribonuclease-3 family protein
MFERTPGNTDEQSDRQSSDLKMELNECPVDLPTEQALSTGQVQQLSPAALAYLGDAVYELYIRRQQLFPPKRIQTYHQHVVARVRAESQARDLRSLLPHLSSNELEVVRRGRNAATGRSKRIDLETYQQATSLETLIGYLYLTDPQRLMQLLSQLETVLSDTPP